MNERSDQQTHKGEDHRVVRVEIFISNILRVGVLASLACIAFGIIVTFLRDADTTGPDALLHLTQSTSSFPHTIPDVFAGVAALHGQAIIALGLLVLVATPVIRVAVSIMAFVYQRDRTFVVITSIVLGLLLLSFLLGKAGG